MPHPNRPRPSQLHHHQTYGAEPDAPSARQGLPTPQAKGRRMGRRLPRQPHRSIICSPDCPATLDQMVEVTFTVSPRVRRIPAHDPDSLSPAEYYRQVFWGSGIDFPENFDELFARIILRMIVLAPGERASLSLSLPAELVII